MKLTKRQRQELERMTRGPQYTFGKGRARVQNMLVGARLSEFVVHEGSDFCRITALGRAALNRGDAKAARAIPETTR